MNCQVLRPVLEAKIATKSDLGAPGSVFEPSEGSWRLPKGSWRHFGALLAAFGAVLRLPGRTSGTRFWASFFGGVSRELEIAICLAHCM